jgi:hypothetical protein
MMILVLIVGGGSGWILYRARVQREAVAAIRAGGGQVFYDFELTRVYDPEDDSYTYWHSSPKKAKWPKWVEERIGIDYFATVIEVTLAQTDTDALMAHVGRLDYLKRLSIYCDERLSDAGMAHLEGLTNLERLEFTKRGAKVTGAGLKHIGALKKLRYLSLGSFTPNDSDLSFAAGLHALRSLHFNADKITDAGLAHVRELDQLRRLGIARAPITSAGLVHLSTMTHMRSLNLSDTLVDDLSPLAGLTDLRELVLSGTPLNDSGGAAIGGFNKLVTLDLDHTQIGDDVVQLLRDKATIETLILGGTRVTDAGLLHLQGMLQLKLLNLDRTLVSDPGVASLITAPRLENLWLRKTRVTDKGLESLARFPRLVNVDVSDNRVTIAGLKQLAASRTLKGVHVYGLGLTDRELKLVANPGSAINSIQFSK